MRLEVVRMVTDWLRRTDGNGVNDMIPLVPRDEGDDQPLELPVVESEDGEAPAVYDVTRHEWVARRLDPPNLPCLYVTTEGSIDVHGEEMTGNYRDTETPLIVAVRYLATASDLQRGITAGEYVLRAVRMSMNRLMQQEQDGARTRNNVVMTAFDRGTYHPIVEAIGEARVAGALTMEFDVRDAAP